MGNGPTLNAEKACRKGILTLSSNEVFKTVKWNEKIPYKVYESTMNWEVEITD